MAIKVHSLVNTHENAKDFFYFQFLKHLLPETCMRDMKITPLERVTNSENRNVTFFSLFVIML